MLGANSPQSHDTPWSREVKSETAMSPCVVQLPPGLWAYNAATLALAQGTYNCKEGAMLAAL
jgi:hypothetical protein